ncbi:MAG TPA: tRNA (N6-isopentenyl adenosine(37)-C2)-methylthiotransferase MiaB [Syntrophorhabdaceae bacterium]|nr:tRNA (N6-isopentenyl adenosine(37)-C2)-methylthiotransferase MiaB [Syntrophorhabdaceae bacterium]HQM75811.1 tRNA (N6-isopentenyl adenosine(37)-C2)-methylthiotransferase MiaB [Syntrophorhabdaceae bacterium]
MKYFIQTFGCQMNEHDSEKMDYLLQGQGYIPVKEVREADVIVVNTCCVREKAEQKFYSFMGRLKALKARYGKIIGVTGCIAQLEKNNIKERLPFVDFSLGPSNIHKITDAIDKALNNIDFMDFSENGYHPGIGSHYIHKKNDLKAFITIMKGCNNFCSYCIVPYVRGREISRHSKDILNEIKMMSDNGVKEIILLGQNVNSYNKGNNDLSFPELLETINEFNGIERIRFVTSHPKDLSPNLIECFGRLEKLCEQIHLPFQAGSDKILRLMNRGYTVKQYIDKITHLRMRCSDIAITSDCIVGFPGEDDDAFNETMELITLLEFDGIFSFVYSPRKYAAASNLPNDVTKEKALERLRHLQTVQKAITIKKNRAMEGKTFQVLVEGASKNSNEELTGRTRTNKIVNFKGKHDMIGSMTDVKIIKGYANSLKGEEP